MKHCCLKDAISETNHPPPKRQFDALGVKNQFVIRPKDNLFLILYSGLIKHELLYKMMCHLTPPVGFGKKCPKSVAYKVSTNRRSRWGCSLKKWFKNVRKFSGKYILLNLTPQGMAFKEFPEIFETGLLRNSILKRKKKITFLY